MLEIILAIAGALLGGGGVFVYQKTKETNAGNTSTKLIADAKKESAEILERANEKALAIRERISASTLRHDCVHERAPSRSKSASRSVGGCSGISMVASALASTTHPRAKRSYIRRARTARSAGDTLIGRAR